MTTDISFVNRKKPLPAARTIRSLIDANSASGSCLSISDGHIDKIVAAPYSQKLLDQALWLTRLNPSQASGFPSVCFGYWTPTFALLSTKFIPMLPMSELVDEMNTETSERILVNCLDWLAHELHSSKQQTDRDCLALVITQTLQRVKQAAVSHPAMGALLARQQLVINDVAYQSPLKLIRELELIAEARPELRANWMHKIHGDVHLGNILTDLEKWALVDPRGVFPGGGDHFDLCYEWGKVLHDLHGMYNLICSKHIWGDANLDIGTIQVNLPSSHFTDAYASLLRAFLNRVALKYEDYEVREKYASKMLLYEGLLILGILPFHLQHLERAVSLLAFGTMILHHAIIAFDEKESALEFISRPITRAFYDK